MTSTKAAEYRAANREKIRAYHTAWRNADLPGYNAKAAAYREANREKIRLQKAAYREANREKLRAYPSANPAVRRAAEVEWVKANAKKKYAINAKWRAANPDKMRKVTNAWRAINPERRRVYRAARRAKKLQAQPRWLTFEHRAEILRWYRRARAEGLEVDHIVPLQGKNVSGLHVPWNMQLLTPIDNARKGISYDPSPIPTNVTSGDPRRMGLA